MMNEKKKAIGIDFNSPVVLTFSLICLAALLMGMLTGDKSTVALFCVYRSSFRSPLTYLRLIGHVFGHSGWEHFINNITMILVIGPLLEEKYGSKDIMFVIIATAISTGIIHLIFFPNSALLGASGVVFAFILMAPITSFKDGKIPLTFILVAIFYIGGQIYQGIFLEDNVSNLTHIIGGIVGAACGYMANKTKTSGEAA